MGPEETPGTPPTAPDDGAPALRAVTAVVVTDDVTPYLERTLASLAEQGRLPERLLVVDVAERPAEDLATLLDAVGPRVPTTLVRARGAASFGAAVDRAVRTLEVEGDPAPEFLWLLHDDSAPAPDALAELLRVAAGGVAVVGPKQRGWVEPDALLEVGLRATRSARRAVDLEDDEIDQGQHDRRGEVLAVGTAGMLVRSDVLARVGGFDPALGPFGDGLELCRRVRLAGHRVAVAPRAVVHHARASFEGMRPAQDPEATHRRDRRRSFRARRSAQNHNALVAAPAGLVLLLLAGLVLVAPLRALARLVGKEPILAAAELGAAADLLGSTGAVSAARRRVRRAATLPVRSLAPVETDAREIRAARRERRRHRAELARMRRAPSELEIEERAALATGRRATLAALSGILAVLGLVLSGRLLGGLPAGGAIAALPGTLGRTWEAARSSWVTAGLGHAGPADPLPTVLTLLAAPGTLLGLAPSTSLALLLVLAPLAAGVGAWFAAGAATRRLVTRAWVALVWALSPTLLLALTHGRVGALLAAAALPWVALSVAWVTGHRRRDVLLPGLVGARRRRRRPAAGPERPRPDGPRRFDVFADLVEMEEGAPTQPRGPLTDVARAQPLGGSVVVDAETLDLPDEQDYESFDAAPALPGSGHNATVSLVAAAGGGLALAIATAGMPILLPVSAALLALVALATRHGARHLAVLWAVPFVVHLPQLIAVARAPHRWRALLADTGPALPAPPADGLGVLLGWPQEPAALGDLGGAPLLSSLTDGSGATAAETIAWAWAPLVLMALAVLVLRNGSLRATRLGWLVAAVGVLTHLASTRVLTGVGAVFPETSALVAGWGGAGTLLVTGGLLLAVAAADGAGHERRAWNRALHRGDAHGGLVGGRRRAAVTTAAVTGVLAAIAGVVPLLGSAALVLAAASGHPGVVEARQATVPALSVQSMEGPGAGRTLLLDRSEDALVGRILRGDGPLLTETSTLAGADAAAGVPDPLGARTAAAAAALTTGAEDAADRLRELGVAVVVVPPVDATGTSSSDRETLVQAVDAVAGLERVTVNETGTVWRVAEQTSRAYLADAEGTLLAPLDAGPVRVETRVEDGDVPDGGGLVVLAERADDGWHATLDGRELPSVDGPHGAQAFEIPAGGHLVVDHHAPAHTLVGLLQLVVVVGAALLAVPTRRGGPLA